LNDLEVVDTFFHHRRWSWN